MDIKIYKLAKELKCGVKQIIRYLRTLGREVIFSSEFISDELAEKVRQKFIRSKQKMSASHREQRATDAPHLVSKVKKKRWNRRRRKIVPSDSYKCIYCNSIILQTKWDEHVYNCEKRPQNKFFTEKVFEKKEINHIPYPAETKHKSKVCRICGESYPMWPSDICYQCKDK